MQRKSMYIAVVVALGEIGNQWRAKNPDRATKPPPAMFHANHGVMRQSMSGGLLGTERKGGA